MSIHIRENNFSFFFHFPTWAWRFISSLPMFSFFPPLNIKAPKRYIQFNHNTWYNNWVALTRKYTFFPAEISNFSGSRFPLCSVGHLQSYYHSLVMWLDTSQAFLSMIGGKGRLSLISFSTVVFSDKNTFLRYIPISNMFIRIPRMGKKIFFPLGCTSTYIITR